MAPSSGLGQVAETGATRQLTEGTATHTGSSVSHSSTIKLWMDGARETLGVNDRATCPPTRFIHRNRRTRPPSPVPNREGPVAPSSGLGQVTGTGATRQLTEGTATHTGSSVSHSSTIKLWMNGARETLGVNDRATCPFQNLTFTTDCWRQEQMCLEGGRPALLASMEEQSTKYSCGSVRCSALAG